MNRYEACALRASAKKEEIEAHVARAIRQMDRRRHRYTLRRGIWKGALIEVCRHREIVTRGIYAPRETSDNRHNAA